MYRLALAMIVIFSACNGNDNDDQADDGSFNYERFSNRFKAATAPYSISDTSLLNNRDTGQIRGQFSTFIPDSLTKKLFGTAKVTYKPLVRLQKKDAESYYVLNVSGSGKKTALVVVFDKENEYAASFPLLQLDNDPATTQLSTIDKSFSIIRNVSRKMTNDINKEGRDVYAYDPATKSFTLVMTDILDDRNLEVINPIDTLAKTHPLAGDYRRGKRNIVSIRDGSSTSVVNFYIYFENEQGDCSGELKGNAVLTSSKTAVYRQGGDPCVLELAFSGNNVSLKEVEGCGARRGLDCSFNGAFTRKKPAKTPTAKSKSGR